MTDREGMPSHHGEDSAGGGEYPNDTIRLLLERSTCRSFEDKPIPDEILRLICEAGTHAPTGGNLQPFSIIKTENKEVSKKLAKLCGNQEFIATAPVNLLYCLDWHLLHRWAEVGNAPYNATNSFRHFWISFQDCIIAAQNMCTAADALGLGSCYVGTVLECFPELREMFELPDEVFPVVLLSVGYPKYRPGIKRKLDIDVIVHDEKYRQRTDEEVAAVFAKKYPTLKVEITEERLADIHEVCCKVHGMDFADKCVAKIKEAGFINPVQRYFGLHYIADGMAEDNDEYLKMFEDFGFKWFRKWFPVGE